MKKIIYLLLLIIIFLIPRTTFAATKVNVSTADELRSAIEATTDNEITLTNNIEVTYDNTLEDADNYLIVSGGKHILNLNNHNIITESSAHSDYGIITVLGGSLTIKGNGKVAAQNVVLSVMGGTLTISGGTYVSGDQNHVDLVLITYGGKIIINKGTFTGNTYAEGPDDDSGGGEPSQGSSLPILSSNVAAKANVNRNNASQRLGTPLNTKPAITINEGTFNSTTYVENTDLTINGGTFGGDNAVEVAGSNSKLTVTDGTLKGDDIGLLVNTSTGDPVVNLQGGTYSCTDCEEQSLTFGGITIGPFADQKDGAGLLRNLLGNNASINDATVTEQQATYNTTDVYFYHTNQTVKVSTPVQPQEQSQQQNIKEVTNPDTSDDILLSIILLISSLSIIVVGTKKLIKN